MTSGAEFILSTAGILKIISLLCIMIGGLIFITLGGCDSEFWAVAYIVSATVGACLAMLSYTTYALDLIKSPTGLKVQHIVEITVAYVVFLLLLIVSIISMTQCTKKYTIDYVPEPMTIIGAILLAIGGTVLFLDWRSTERIDDIQVNVASQSTSRANPHLSRKSILV